MLNRNFYRLVAIGLVAAAVMWSATGLVQTALFSANQARTVTPRGDLAAYEKSAADVFDATAPSVVYIFTEIAQRTGFGEQRVGRGAGSGFIWDQAGHIITNNHVIANAERVFVRFDTGATVPATIVGRSPDHDMAVLRVGTAAAALRPIAIGSSTDLRIGQAAFAIGNPFGLSRTLTMGIVSAVGRTLPTQNGRDIEGVIQTDAAINPGNSGGPLLDSAGRLIGMTTAILSESGSSAGIGFAIPVDTINRIVPQIITRGKPSRPGIGVSVAGEDIAARFGVKGVIVVGVAEGGPAAKAGLVGVDRNAGSLGDVITAVDGTTVTTPGELSSRLERIGVGKKATLTVERSGQSRSVSVDVVDIG